MMVGSAGGCRQFRFGRCADAGLESGKAGNCREEQEMMTGGDQDLLLLADEVVGFAESSSNRTASDWEQLPAASSELLGGAGGRLGCWLTYYCWVTMSCDDFAT